MSSSSSSTNPTPAAIRLSEKQRELAGFLQLNQLSHAMSNQLQLLSHQFALGLDGLQATEVAVDRWQNVFRAAHLAFASRASASSTNYDETPIDMLVRIPVKSPASP